MAAPHYKPQLHFGAIVIKTVDVRGTYNHRHVVVLTVAIDVRGTNDNQQSLTVTTVPPSPLAPPPPLEGGRYCRCESAMGHLLGGISLGGGH